MKASGQSVGEVGYGQLSTGARAIPCRSALLLGASTDPKGETGSTADNVNELRDRTTRCTKFQEPPGPQSGALSHSFECVTGVLLVPSARITKTSALPSTPLVAWTIHLPSGE